MSMCSFVTIPCRFWVFTDFWCKVLFVTTLHEKQVRNWSLVQKGYKGQTRRESGTQEEVKKKKGTGWDRDERWVGFRIMRLFVCVALLQSSPWALLVSIIASQVTASQPLSYSTHVFAHILEGLALHPNDFIPWIWLTTCLFFFFCLWFWMFIINLYKSSSGNCCFFPSFLLLSPFPLKLTCL